MNPPCDIEPKLVSSDTGPYYRLDYFASEQGCVFFEEGSDWFSDSIAEVRITNTSNMPFTIFTPGGGSLRPQSSFELEFPDQITYWRTGPPSKTNPAQVETVVLPGITWKSNAALIMNPMVGIAIKNRRPLARSVLPVKLEEPRSFAVMTKFFANLIQNSVESPIKIDLRSVLNISYFPEEDPIDK